MDQHISKIGTLTVPRAFLGKIRAAINGLTSELPLQIEETVEGKNVTVKLRGEEWAITIASNAIETALDVDEEEEKESWQS